MNYPRTITLALPTDMHLSASVSQFSDECTLGALSAWVSFHLSTGQCLHYLQFLYVRSTNVSHNYILAFEASRDVKLMVAGNDYVTTPLSQLS